MSSHKPTDEPGPSDRTPRPESGTDASMAKLDDSELQRLYRDATMPADRASCPDAGELSALVVGASSARDRSRLALHLAECSECATEVQALKRAPKLVEETSEESWVEEPTRIDPLSPAPLDPSQVVTPRRAWLLAASILLVVACVVVLQVLRPLPPDGIRSSVDTVEATPRPDSSLDAAPESFSWGGAGGEYRFRLLTASGDVVAEVRGTGLELSVDAFDAQAREVLGRGGRFLWTVELSSSERLGPFWFEVEEPRGR